MFGTSSLTQFSNKLLKTFCENARSIVLMLSTVQLRLCTNQEDCFGKVSVGTVLGTIDHERELRGVYSLCAFEVTLRVSPFSSRPFLIQETDSKDVLRQDSIRNRAQNNILANAVPGESI